MNSLIRFLASDLIVVPIVIGLFVLWRADPPQRKLLVFRALVAAISLIILVGIAHRLFPETRPYLANNIPALITHPPTDNSFPSEHTATGMGISLLILPFSHGWGVVSLFLSLLVGLGRIGAHVHYPVDIVGGTVVALLANIVSWLIVRNPSKRSADQPKSP